MSLRCKRCHGSGEIMGGGMIFIDCVSCNGSGRLEEESQKPIIEVDRRSVTYKQAIKKIMESSKVSKEEAAKIFDEEFEKL